MGRDPHRNESSSGALGMLILRTLCLHELHGYGIAQVIQQSPERELLAEEGSLYPALQRLDLDGWIEGDWGVTSGHRRVRIYRITTAGRQELAALTCHSSNVGVSDAPANATVKSCVLFGCAVTAAAFGQQPAHDLPAGGIPVYVCMEHNQDLHVSTAKAKSLVSVMFSRIGVNLIWRGGFSDCGAPPGESVRTTFTIRWTQRAPFPSSSDALASARPFGSSDASITIYEAPLQRFLRQYANAPELVLAYVLAHELAHVMQRSDYHSTSGILMAKWSYREYYMMLSGALAFTAQDVDLIHSGLKAKRSALVGREQKGPAMGIGFEQ